jgi:hypothetical protein
MWFKKKRVYTEEEIDNIIAKAVYDSGELGCFIVPSDLPPSVTRRILDFNNARNKRNRLNIWKERRHNRRWV